MDRRLLYIAVVAITLVNTALYSRTASYEFVNYDDRLYVLENPLIRRFDTASIGRIFTRTYAANYQPLVLVSYALEHSFFGFDPKPYHIANTALHAINSLLVLLLIYHLANSVRIAFLIALLFSIHPVQMETVAWVSEQKGLLCTLFYLLAFIAYIRSAEKGKTFYTGLSILLFLLALLSKPTAITFPIILVSYDYLKDNLNRSTLIEKIPFFAISALFVIVTLFAQKKATAFGSDFGAFFYLNQIIFSFYTMGFYIAKLVFPRSTSVYYGYPKVINIDRYIISMIVFVAFALYVRSFKRTKREVNFGLLFFTVSLLPILRIIPIGHTFAADRYLYLPMIGLFFAIAFLLEELIAARPALKNAVVAVVVGFVVFSGVKTHMNLKIWQNSYNLWSNVLTTAPGYYNALMGIGSYFMEKNDTARAKEYFQQALGDETGREVALFNLGVASLFDNDVPGAEKFFSTLVEEFPANRLGNNAAAFLYLARIMITRGEYANAAALYEKSLALDRSNEIANREYSNLLKELDRGTK
jgi:hypothetical protein